MCGGILVDKYSLGKILTTLDLIFQLLKHGSIPFKLILMVSPTGLIDMWIRETHIHFREDLMIIIFHRLHKHSSEQHWLGQVVNTVQELQELLQSLDPDNPSTATTVVFTMYKTWSIHTTEKVSEQGHVVTCP